MDVNLDYQKTSNYAKRWRRLSREIERKTPIYWAGLVFAGLSVWALLFVLWGLMTMRGPISSGAFFPFAVFTSIGALIFLLIGTFMMKEGRGA